MTTRAAQFEILAAGVQYNADLVTTPYVTFFDAGTDTPKNAWDDKDKSSAFTKLALDTQGRGVAYGDGVYKLKFYTGDPDAAAPLTGVLLFTIDDYKVEAANFSVLTKTGTYTATPDDDLILCSGTWTLSLQAVANFDHPLEVLNTGSGNITIDPNGAETIEGSATLVLGADERVRMIPDAASSAWRWTDYLADVASHAAATGTAVHGLGTMSTQTIAAVTDSIIPNSDNSIDLGSSSKEFKDLYVDGTAYMDGISIDGVSQGKDVTAALHRKIVNIGDWNMDSTQYVYPAHGLTLSKIYSATAIIRNDADNTRSMAAFTAGVNALELQEIGATTITLARSTSGPYDNVSFDSTSYNRGWIIIDYVD